MSRTRVTLKDVAAASGVSAATVSFVLNRVTGQTIPAATQERVRRAADELGYVPHGSARALREGSSRLVLLNAGRLPVAGSLRSFIDGLDTELAAHGHTLLVRHGTDTGALKAAVDTANPRAVLDLVRLYADDDPDRLDGGWIDGLAAHTAAQIEYLIERGHTRIGFAMPTDPRLARIARLRFQQARAVADHRELTVFDIDAPGDVTAVAAFDDDVALRLLSAMADRGLSAPGDLAVIGFDDTGYGGMWRPALTTVRIDAAGYGRRAARAVLGLPLDTVLPEPSTVVVRASA
ncbi:LacI family DNA-binding transcriptional regulator [Actinoplanes derwentensis]|uniref:DNA-binding transcriptional regulator, LacI/PurR family n=1 Tax=Actinoplanes derwentensis TaxID=113562 RepID=A0A1H1T4E1_9ACTN|nr:LacI family DNA-binding transcriptional regulator [Actinoplanes derwentensis]GID89931.1 LacI family transcriptional regulator [Actinoplanes derwentensis]SDS55078.1 DNA-binding transcriptional regulator, LacI/PurR family [Actinoplanes derwentensis]